MGSMGHGLYAGHPVQVVESSRLRTSRHDALPISRIRFRGSRSDCWVLSSEIMTIANDAEGKDVHHRSIERTDFIKDLMKTALYHADYGWFEVRRNNGTEAVIVNRETHEEHLVTLDLMSKGLRIIRSSVAIDKGRKKVRIDPKTGEEVHFDGPARAALIEADRSNGVRGSYEVTSALAVLECGLFGKVMYT